MASNNRLGESMVNRLFPWWIGVVEDRMDSMGRVRVRVYGFHTSDVKKLKTKDHEVHCEEKRSEEGL